MWVAGFFHSQWPDAFRPFAHETSWRENAFRISGPLLWHDDVIKWKHFPRYWPSVRGIHRVPVNSPHKGQWRGALMFSLICVWINGWVNNREAGDLRRYRAHYDVTVMGNHIWPVDCPHKELNMRTLIFFLLVESLKLGLTNSRITGYVRISIMHGLPNDAIWWPRSGSTLARVMPCCLMIQRHYLNPFFLLSRESIFSENTHDITL